MRTLSIDHIEFYVGDAIAMTQSLCSVYGFRVYGRGGPETGLPGQRSVLLGQGAIRILLTSGLHEDHPASQFVARHGDGVAVIGFRTDGAAAYADAVAAGATSIGQPRSWENDKARVVTAEIEGFGEVAYRLVERHGLDGRVPARCDRDGAWRRRRGGRRPAHPHRPRGAVRAGREA